MLPKGERNSVLYVKDMIQGIDRIGQYLEGLTYATFFEQFMAQDAVIRNFQIIGEAARNVDVELKARYPMIPCKKMYGLRNLISHEYFGIDLEMIWEIATKNLPDNRVQLQQLLEDIQQD